MFNMFLNMYLKLFFILTPFVVLSTFLTWTRDYKPLERRAVVRRVLVAILLICLILSLCGNFLFAIMGITLDAFRIGAGILLLMSAVSLVQGKQFYNVVNHEQDITVVPLAIPVAVGPGTIGILLVMGSQLVTLQERLVGAAAMLGAVATLGVILYAGNALEKKLGRKGLDVMSKLTGLVLSALAVQIIMKGLEGFNVIQ